MSLKKGKRKAVNHRYYLRRKGRLVNRLKRFLRGLKKVLK